MKKLLTASLFLTVCFGAKATEISIASYWDNEIKIWLYDNSKKKNYEYYYKDPHSMSCRFGAYNESDGTVRITCRDVGTNGCSHCDPKEIIDYIKDQILAIGFTIAYQGVTDESYWIAYNQSSITRIKIW